MRLQASMEFLIIVGVVILVSLIVVSSLGNFNIFNFSFGNKVKLNEISNLLRDVSLKYSIRENGLVSVSVKANTIKFARNVSLNISGCVIFIGDVKSSWVVKSKLCDFLNGSNGDDFSFNCTISYVDDAGLSHSDFGVCIGKWEEGALTIFVLQTQSDFDEGTYINTTWGSIRLLSGYFSGAYISKIFDLGKQVNWTEVKWYGDLPYRREFKNGLSVWHFNHVSGPVVDSMGRYNGTSNNVSRGADGIFGNSFNFSNGYVVVPDFPNITNLTIEAWVYNNFSIYPKFEFGNVVVNNSWRKVVLKNKYINPIIITGYYEYNNSLPASVRIKNISNNSFYIKLQNPSGSNLNYDKVYYFVIEEGDWIIDGKKIEAHRYYTNTVSYSGLWSGDVKYYNFTYSTNPVVFHQVVSNNDPAWVSTWVSSRTSRQYPPDNLGFQISLMRGEGNPNHGGEYIDWVVIEEGIYKTSNSTFEVRKTSQSIRGHDNGCYSFPIGTYISPNFIISQQEMRGNNGGWLVICNLASSSIKMHVEEDQLSDSERSHIPEIGAYLVGEGVSSYDIIKKGESYELSLSNGTLFAWINNVVLSYPLPEGWNFIALTYNSSVMSLYINGSLISQINYTLPVVESDSPLYIGKGFNGFIDEVRILNKSLTNGEIMDDYLRGVLSLNLSYKVCNSSCDSVSWINVGSSNTTINSIGRYFQFKFDFLTNNSLYTPILHKAIIKYK